MTKKILFRLPFFVVGILVAFVLYQFTPPLNASEFRWWMVAYIIIGLVVTEWIRIRNSKVTKN